MKKRTVQLGDVCDFIRGVTFPSGEGRSEHSDDAVACLTTSGVQQEIAWRSRRFIPRERVKNKRQMLRAGDVLVSTANSKELVGKSCIVKTLPFECTFGAFVTAVRPHETLHPQFLAYWMSSAGFLSWCYRMSANTTNISNLRVTDLEEMPFSLPSLSEQRRIAAMLEQANQLRRTRRYTLELSDSFLPAAFLKMFGDEGTFGLSRVEEVLAQKSGAIRTGPFGSQLLHSEFTDSGIAVLGIDNAVNNCFEWSERRFISPQKYKELARYTVFPGDVIITIMGTCGRCAIVPDDIPTAINTKHLCCITLDQKRCLPVYLQGAFLYHPHVRHQLRLANKGAIMDGLNMEIIKNLRIPIPPLTLQQRFADLVRGHERLWATQRESLRQAEHLFQSLLHRAFEEGA